MRTKKSEINYVSCDNCEMDPLCRPIEVAGKSLDLIEGVLHRRELIKKGKTLFRVGDAFNSFQSISSGSFKLVVPGNPDKVAGFCFSGELMDAGAMYTGSYCYDAVALEDSYVCAIPRESVEELGRQIPDFQKRLIELMSEQLFHVSRILTLLAGRRTADERMAAFLVGISIRYQERGYPAEQFRLSMGREDIACYLGLVKSTVSRILTRFHKQGLIASSGKHFQLNDIDELSRLAGISNCVSAKAR